MRYDAWRFIIVFSLSFIIGAMSSYGVAFATGLGFFIVWQYNKLRNLLTWLQKRSRIGGPEQTGIINDICREIDFIMARNHKHKKKLKRFLNSFQKSANTLPYAVVMLGINDEITWANKKAREYLGICWPQDSGLRIGNLVRRPELIQYLNADADGLMEWLQMVCPVEHNAFLEIHTSSFLDKKLLVAWDVTNIYRTNQMRKEFIANASHELRTPLTVISGYLESFVDDDLCPEDWLAHIRQMRAQAARMQGLLDDLLTLSVLEAGDVSNNQDIVKVSDMLAIICNEAKTLSGDMQHRIELVADAKLCVFGSYTQLYSAFSNIIFNAVQYTPANSKVLIRWYQDVAGAHMTVTDNGPGIDAEHIPRLTERFYRVDKCRSREKGGTGLGLAIVKHVLAKHGGDLVIESEPGSGSVFCCNLAKSQIAQQE